MTGLRLLRPAATLTIVLVLITGLMYPLLITGVAQVLMETKAGGSLVERDGMVVASTLIGQSFSDNRYFHGRISAAGVTDQNPGGYDALASGASNLAPGSPVLVERVQSTIAAIAAREGTTAGRIPADAVYASGSGLDPHISPAYAEMQIARVARTRGMTEDTLRQLVREHTAGRQLGVLGEARVNIITLNLALDAER